MTDMTGWTDRAVQVRVWIRTKSRQLLLCSAVTGHPVDQDILQSVLRCITV